MEPISLKPEKREDSYDLASPASPSESCPRAYLTGPKELAELPKGGTVTFRFKREELSLRDGQKAPVSVVLKLEAIVDASAEEAEMEDDAEDDSEDAGESLDRKMKRAVGQADDEEIED
jgi:hypothetical protein